MMGISAKETGIESPTTRQRRAGWRRAGRGGWQGSGCFSWLDWIVNSHFSFICNEKLMNPRRIVKETEKVLVDEGVMLIKSA